MIGTARLSLRRRANEVEALIGKNSINQRSKVRHLFGGIICSSSGKAGLQARVEKGNDGALKRGAPHTSRRAAPSANPSVSLLPTRIMMESSCTDVENTIMLQVLTKKVSRASHCAL